MPDMRTGSCRHAKRVSEAADLGLSSCITDFVTLQVDMRDRGIVLEASSQRLAHSREL